MKAHCPVHSNKTMAEVKRGFLFELTQNFGQNLPPVQHGALRMQKVSDSFIRFYSALKT